MALFHGQEDVTVPQAQTQALGEVFRSAGVQVETERYFEGKSHTDPIVEDAILASISGKDALMEELMTLLRNPRVYQDDPDNPDDVRDSFTGGACGGAAKPDEAKFGTTGRGRGRGTAAAAQVKGDHAQDQYQSQSQAEADVLLGDRETPAPPFFGAEVLSSLLVAIARRLNPF